MTLSDSSINPREVRRIREGEDASTSIPADGTLQSPRDVLQAELQTIEISGSTPGQSTADFSTGPNVWDFHNLDFMEETPLWAIDNSFAINGIQDGTSAQLEDLQLHGFDYSGGHDISNGHELSGKPGTPAILDLRSIWFTKVQRSDESPYHPFFLAETTPTSQPTSSPREPEIVDEECRRDLTRSLVHPFPQEDLLPSSAFLVVFPSCPISVMLTLRRIFVCAGISHASTQFSLSFTRGHFNVPQKMASYSSPWLLWAAFF
jgi:hypothetical protein